MSNRARLAARQTQGLHWRLKAAQLAAMTELDFKSEQEKLEQSPIFGILKAAGAVRLTEFPRARFAAKQFAGYGIKLSAGSGVSALLDGKGDIIELIQHIGQEKFEECFLKSEASDVEASDVCDITLDEARQLREFVDRVYIQAEFEDSGAASAAPAERVYSAVAGISIENGKPALAFFNREIWKGQYSVNEAKLAECLHVLSPRDARKAESCIGKLQFFERRKTTLYKLFEILLKEQADYLVSGEPKRRKPLTQRELSGEIGVDPSVLNRLVSNKSVQLPWGLEAPLVMLIPSAKDIAKELLYELAAENRGLSDEKMRQLLVRKHGVKLSRRSVAQYRKELGAIPH